MIDARAGILKLEDLLRALGRMTIRFQELEESFRWVFASLVDSSDLHVGNIAAHKQSFKNLVNATEVLYIHRHPNLPSDEIVQVKSWFSKCRSAEAERNQLIHSVWETYPNERGAFKRTKHNFASKTLVRGVHEVTPDQIEKFNDRLDELSAAIMSFVSNEFVDRLLAALDKSDETGDTNA